MCYNNLAMDPNRIDQFQVALEAYQELQTELRAAPETVAAPVIPGIEDVLRVLGPLPPETKLPPSLYLKDMPTFWPKDLAWPPFGPEVAGSASARIPAQLRYEVQYRLGEKE